MKKGIFITIEGPDGSGKTTQALLLVRYLKGKGYPVVHTREPGGTEFSEKIRNVILEPGNQITPLAEFLLYSASRAQHVEKLLKPSLSGGQIVVCERFSDASLAYQGYGRGLSLNMIKKVNQLVTRGIVPDLTILLDISSQVGMNRIKKRKSEFKQGDRLEQEIREFHQKVRAGYLKIAKENYNRYKVISGSAYSAEKIQGKIIGYLGKLLRDKK